MALGGNLVRICRSNPQATAFAMPRLHRDRPTHHVAITPTPI
ncbi:MAG: hypothetical protein ACLSIL_10645 [Enterococcus casseliflavus]